MTISIQKIAHVRGFVQYSDYLEGEAKIVLLQILRSKKLHKALLTKNKEAIVYVTGVYEVARLQLVRQLPICLRTEPRNLHGTVLFT